MKDRFMGSLLVSLFVIPKSSVLSEPEDGIAASELDVGRVVFVLRNGAFIEGV